MTKRALLYGRVSGDDKAKTGGANLRAQLDLCREYAKKQGYTIIAELSEDDRGASGAAFDLPQLSKAMDMARNGEYDVLIARELDRLSRNLAKQLIVEEELKRSGVLIEYALYDFPNTPEGRLNKNMRGMLAEYEREKIAQRMIRGTRRILEAGNTNTGGKPPLGYNEVITDGRRGFVIRESEAATIRIIFEWYTQGDGTGGPLSIRKITRKLTGLRIPTYADLRKTNGSCVEKTHRKYGEWSLTSVSAILGNETYAGVWRRDNIAVEVPAIVDKATWDMAQELKERNKYTAPRNTKHEYLLQHRMVCGGCGNAMRATTGYSGVTKGADGKNIYKRTYTLYKCNTRNFCGHCANPITIRADWADNAAWEWLTELFQDTAAWQQALEEARLEKETQLLPRRRELESIAVLITENEEARERVKQLFYAKHITLDEYEKDKQPYESALVGLRKEQARLEALVAEQDFSAAQMQSIVELGMEVRDGILNAGGNFGKRRLLIDMLDVTGKATVIDGQKTLRLTCVVGKSDRIEYTSTSRSGRRAAAGHGRPSPG